MIGYLKKINDGLDKFCKIAIKKLSPKCIILYGSLARGDFNERSDVDIIIITSNLPNKYFKRAKLLYDLIETADPIEPLGFTPEEFSNMIQKRNCTSLFAMEEGKALYGEKYFSFLKKIYEKIVNKYQLVKSVAAWIPKSKF
ncbi:MAG: nucleotidyltransferase domain-containing protein [Candidatus Helarchaeota archaeon]|nr:nucleotidyltransferase domain-containing protein [Candidatus Helarchaeota archaeon]